MIINFDPRTWFAKKQLYKPASGFTTLNAPGVMPKENEMATYPVVIAPAQNPPKTGFFAKFEHFFTHFFGSAPTWVHYAQSVVQFAAPVAIALIGVASPELDLVAVPIINRVQTGLATLAALAGNGSDPVTVASTIATLKLDLADLESVAGVKSDKTKGKIAIILAELEQVAAMLPVAK